MANEYRHPAHTTSFKDKLRDNDLSLTLMAFLLEDLRSSRFWFESFQNWQSEFLAIASMVVSSIFLRQRGSPESKPVDVPHCQTGSK